MWARVAQALDPEGDGRYEVEYRVKQLDGAWKWLSAWGLVEFEGEGTARKAVAIAGASRDLTEMKRAEQLQRLLSNELNHRVKNTLATVQSITSQTLRAATDLDLARNAIEDRIISLARVHDLLTARSWSGADLGDVVERAMQPFPAVQLAAAGPSFDVPPQHALALSLALHELATNAAKYGALSAPDGRVEIRWERGEDELRLTWREKDGPPVAPPTRRGFGSRLLEASLRDLGGSTRLEYAVEGVTAEFAAPLGAHLSAPEGHGGPV
jgi:two-component sensor histidine kinase